MSPTPQEIPDPELDLYLNTVETVVSCAAQGQLVEGHAELVYGLRRAELLREEGHAWADDLVRRYRAAVENYCQSYGVTVPPPAEIPAHELTTLLRRRDNLNVIQ
jgi:hypothetical protein